MHSAHDYILKEGDDAKAMYWLVRGAVAVTSIDGESQYAELKPGAFFGEIGILMDIPRTATIIARSRCMLVVLKKEDLVKELPDFPDVERTIRDEAAERLSILNRKKEENAARRSQNTKLPPVAIKSTKRGRESEDGDTPMMDMNGSYVNGTQASKKRKSPSPGLVEAASSSALGHGLVNVRQLLKELPLFADLPPEILHFLGLNAQPCNYAPFTNIIQQDSQGREIFFIVRGEVEVVDEKVVGQNLRHLPNGVRRSTRRDSQVKARLRQGQYFGEVASLSLAPRRTATIRSISAVECLMITGEVLNDFWTRCPLTIREQVEKTARQRLSSKPDEDVVMTDAAETPPIDELAIADRPTRSPRKRSVPKVTFSKAKNVQEAPPSIHDSPIIQPADPDPFLNADLDSIRSKRRGSLAPPAPEASQTNGDTVDKGSTSPYKRTTSPSKRSKLAIGAGLKHEISPPDFQLKPKLSKRPKTTPKLTREGYINDNILVCIFQHLDLPSLMRLRRVSHHWAKLLKESPELVHHLNLASYNRTVNDSVLTNSICPFVGNRPRTVDISNCFHISDEGFTTLASTCGANVKVWKMKSVWDITAQAVLEMANKAKYLEEVDLSNCRKVSDNLLARVVGWVVQGSPPQNTHAIHRQSAAARSVGAPMPQPQQPPPGTVFGCPKLRKLTLSYCKHVTDRSMAHMAYHAASRLEQIDLTRCTTITDQGFQHWSQFQFSKLTKLCLADCTYLTDNAIVYLTNAAKNLKDLDLVSVALLPRIRHSLIITLQSFCCALSDTATEVLSLGCPHLQNLNLSFCGSAVSDGSLRSISLHLLELRSLSVRGCVRVTGNGVECIVDGCTELERFDVSQCRNLSPWIEAGVPQMPRMKKIDWRLVA